MPIALQQHRHAYRKYGFYETGERRYRCKACGSTLRVSDPARLHAKNQKFAADVFSRIANKSPVRGVVRGARLNSSAAYYRVFDFIHRRCQAHSGAVDRAFIEGRMRLPKAMTIESDAQVYTLNWISRMDRRNVDISSYCSVDASSRFILGLHCNFDAGADAFAINAEAAKNGDMARHEPFRQDARYWLAGDELRAGRSKNFTSPDTRRGLAVAIQALYARAASRDDVEDVELEHMDTAYRTPFLRNGLLVHMPYTTYAHWYLLRQLLDGAGVERVQAHFDINSMSRAAFLCSFLDTIKAKRAHGFYVKYSKHYTVDQRRRVVAESRVLRAAERAAPPTRGTRRRRPVHDEEVAGRGEPARQMARPLVPAPQSDHERTAQGDVLADAGRCSGRRRQGGHVPQGGPSPSRQRLSDDSASLQRL